MKRLLIITVLAIAAWQAFTHYESRRGVNTPPLTVTTPEPSVAPARTSEAAPAGGFSCDGRKLSELGL